MTNETDAPIQPSPQGGPINAELFLAVVLTMVVTCFNPVTRYFFAQDDFTLMLRASSDTAGMLGDFFGSGPGQFRPLTKVIYFAIMYKGFGLNAGAYHVASMVWHMINAALVFVLMRRLRIGAPSALIVTAIFALSTAFFHVIAWIACIQQLMAMCFVLITLIFGIDALRGRGRGSLWISLAAYVLALTSLEQVFAVPLALVMIGRFGDAGTRLPLPALLRRLAPHLAVMAAYGAFLLLWKGLPRDGVYELQVGNNVAINLLLYCKWLVSYWVVLPPVMVSTKLPWSILHIVVLYLVAYNLARMRFSQTLFAATIVLSMLLPVLMLTQHTFFLHTYLPSIGILFLVALMLDDLFALRGVRRDVVQIVVLTAVLIAVFGLSFVRIRQNLTAQLPGVGRLASSFVLRRARIAQQVYVDLKAKTKDPSQVDKVFMIYGRPEGADEASWNYQNVVEALGRGDAVKLFLDDPAIDVSFSVLGDSLVGAEDVRSRIFYFGDFGNCYTPEEAQQIEEIRDTPPPRPPDRDTSR